MNDSFRQSSAHFHNRAQMEKMCISSDCFCFLANTITHNSSRVSRATKVRVGQSWIKIYSRFSRGYTFHPHNYRRRWGIKLATVELAQVVLCDWIYNNEWEFGGGKKFFSAGKAVCSFPPHHHFFFSVISSTFLDYCTQIVSLYQVERVALCARMIVEQQLFHEWLGKGFTTAKVMPLLWRQKLVGAVLNESTRDC